MKSIHVSRLVLIVCAAMLAASCRSTRPPLPLAESVDLDAFMGAWYVMGYTPIVVDKHAYNAVEHYARGSDGRILTTYQFRKGGFDGTLKTHAPTGFVTDPDRPAEWEMQFIWPFKADYRIVHLADDGQTTVIAHPNRKYAWIMTRTPQISEATYEARMAELAAAGMNTNKVLRVPHDWSGEKERLKAIERAGRTQPLAPR